MLLGHTSGVPEWITDEVDLMVAADPSHVWTDDEVLDLIAEMPAWFEPGDGWEYANSNYTLLGMVLDRHGGGSWREQVRKRIIEPLILTSTRLPEPGDLSIAGDYAHGYHEVDGVPVDLSFVDSSMGGASGGHAMITTVTDLARFLKALLGGELFERKATLDAMTAMIDAPHESGFPHRYGLGLESFDLPGLPRVVGHMGSSGGYAVMMFQVPDRNDTIIVTAINTTDLFRNAMDVFIPAMEVIAADRGE
jgi:D-alanyl-D-alanine carboxypeptidase